MFTHELTNRKGQRIVGILEHPDEVVVGTALIQHGWGGTKDQKHIQAIKDVFLKNGFITFVFDTTNSFGESDGDYEKAMVSLHYEDFVDVARWVEQQSWFVAPFAVTGHSTGGYSAARFAAEYPEKVGYCVPIGPVISGKLYWEAYQEFKPEVFKKWKETGILERPSVSDPNNVKRSPWSHMEERLQHDLIPLAGSMTMPVLLYVGSEDTNTPPKHVKQLYDAIPEGKKTMLTPEGIPHSYRTEAEIKNVVDSIDGWLKQVLSESKS